MDFRPFRNGVVLLNHFGAAPWIGRTLGGHQLHRRVRNASPRLPVLGAGACARETHATPAPRQVNRTAAPG